MGWGGCCFFRRLGGGVLGAVEGRGKERGRRWEIGDALRGCAVDLEDRRERGGGSGEGCERTVGSGASRGSARSENGSGFPS